MSDLISRKDAIEALHKKCITEGLLDEFDTEDTLRKLPSAEPEERTAKVSNQIFNSAKPYTVGAWIGTCECGELVSYSSKYCHMCGARLEWNE